MSVMSIVVDGLLKPDGTLEFDAVPRLPPGRVRVTLQLLEQGRTAAERLPDAPWADASISAPFDLPYLGTVEPVHPRNVGERLPDPLDVPQEAQ